MTPELTYLLYAALLLIAHVLVQATLSDLAKGLGWALGAQDEPRDQHDVADRVQRSLKNYLETLPVFIILAILLHLTDKATAATATGAAIYFWARVAYIPAFAVGIFGLRSVVWFVSLAGLAMMALPLF